MKKTSKKEWDLILSEIDSDENADTLEDIFPEEALNILKIQEGHYGLSTDPKGIYTTFFGITKNGVKTASQVEKYTKIEVPEYVKRAWEILGNESNYNTEEGKANCEKLAGRVNQYYQWFQSSLLDGYTSNKFSNLPAITRYAVLIDSNPFSMYKMENSLLVEAIRLNNRALIAKSLYSSGRKDIQGNEIVDEAGFKKFFPFQTTDSRSFKHYFNSKLSMANDIPSVEEYKQIEMDTRRDGKKEVPQEKWDMLDKTLDNMASTIFKDNNYWDLADGVKWKNEELQQPRKEQDNITHINIHDKKENVSTAVPVDEIADLMQQKTQQAEALKKTKYNTQSNEDGIINTITNYFANTFKNLFTDNNEVKNAERNTNNNM